MESRFFTSVASSVDAEARSVVAVISSDAIDADGDIVIPKGVVLDRYLANPTLLWSHDPSIVPIGHAEEVVVNEQEITAKFIFNTTDYGEECFKAYKEGGLRAFSIGFSPITWHEASIGERKVVVFDTWELLEVSAVAVGSNPRALAKAASPAFTRTALKGAEDRESKRVVAELRTEENIRRIEAAIEDLSNTKRFFDKEGEDFPVNREKVQVVLDKLREFGSRSEKDQSAGEDKPANQSEEIMRSLTQWTERLSVDQLIGRM